MSRGRNRKPRGSLPFFRISMDDDPYTVLIGDLALSIVEAGRGPFRHTFGGPPRHRGTSRDDCDGRRIHLLHRLDQTDPAVPVTVPGAVWLPLYACFDERAPDLGYRLISDTELVAYFDGGAGHGPVEDSWPSEDYPAQFPASSLTVSEIDYDPSRPEDVHDWAGVFGIDHLTPDEYRSFRAYLIDEVAFDDDLTEEEIRREYLDRPFVQGRPDDVCINPDCAHHDRPGRLTVLAMVPGRPVPGVDLFGRWSDGVQVLFQLCPDCHTIRAGHRST